jgi:hypothetical protein
VFLDILREVVELLNLKELLNIATKREKTRETICSAIRSRRVIEFYYHGGYRTVEPFCLGVVMSGEGDNESLLCYQTGGFSELREVVGWKLYRASEMEDIEILNEQFSGDRPGYDPDDIEIAVLRCYVVPVKEGQEAVAASARKKPEKPDSLALTHNELMRRFRFTHPIPIPDLYTCMFFGPWIKHPPERTEWKNKHFAWAFGQSYLEGQTA